MPIEVELFFDLKISRTVLREAFIVLECLGLVEAHAGVGWRIIGRAPTPLARFPSSLDAVAMLEAGSFFEAEAVALTATIGHQVLPKPVPLKARPTLEDCEAFHVQLAQGAENPAIALSIRNIWQVSLQRPAIRRVLSGALSQVSAHLPDLQTQVIDAVRARHPDVARAAMKRLFHAYLCGVVDFEAEEQLMQASKEHLQNRQTWRERLGSGLSQDFTAP